MSAYTRTILAEQIQDTPRWKVVCRTYRTQGGAGPGIVFRAVEEAEDRVDLDALVELLIERSIEVEVENDRRQRERFSAAVDDYLLREEQPPTWESVEGARLGLWATWGLLLLGFVVLALVLMRALGVLS